jgi:hypothetical protein
MLTKVRLHANGNFHLVWHAPVAGRTKFTVTVGANGFSTVTKAVTVHVR